MKTYFIIVSCVTVDRMISNTADEQDNYMFVYDVKSTGHAIVFRSPLWEDFFESIV